MRLIRLEFLLALFISLLTIFTIWGIRRVPFHPDESTQLFMSSDFDAFFKNPTSLVWRIDKESDPRQTYRELDAPLTKYLIGLGRAIAGLEPLPTDWDWSKTWQENEESGALPPQKLLNIGRLSITLLLPISLLFTFLLGKTIGGNSTGFLAALLLGLNALILLHDRRAMAEGALTLGIVLALWSFIQGDKRPWLAGLGMAVAFNSKQSALALLPAGLLSAIWLSGGQSPRWGKILGRLIQFLGIFALVTFLLNPLYWSHPIETLRASISSRQDLLSRQVSDTRRFAPEQVLDSASRRAAVMLANLYLAPPQFAEVGNYRDDTQTAEQVYLETPGHNLLRNLVGGGILLTLSLAGILLAGFSLRGAQPTLRRKLTILLLGTVSQVAVHLSTIPLPWQRYVMPLLPYTCLWSAYAVGSLLSKAERKT